MDLDVRVRSLLEETGHVLDLLVIDEYPEEHFWHIALDRETLVFAEIDQRRGVLVLSCDVGSVTEKARLQVYELLLRYNHGPAGEYGTSLSLAAADGPVWLWSEFSVSSLDRRTMADWLASFRRKCGAWKQMLVDSGKAVVIPYPDLPDFASGAIIRG